nr:Regulatory protein RecX [Ipomoea batatas]
MGKRKERRLAAMGASSRRVKLDLFAEPSEKYIPKKPFNSEESKTASLSAKNLVDVGKYNSVNRTPKELSFINGLDQEGRNEMDADGAIKLVFKDRGNWRRARIRVVGMSQAFIGSSSCPAFPKTMATEQSRAPRETRKSRVIRWLQYRGFNWSVINFVLKKNVQRGVSSKICQWDFAEEGRVGSSPAKLLDDKLRETRELIWDVSSESIVTKVQRDFHFVSSVKEPMLGPNGPVSLLSDMSRSCKVLGKESGTRPLNAFELRSRNSRFMHPDIEGGTDPMKWLLLMSRKFKIFKFPISTGIVPPSLFLFTRNLYSSVQFPISGGIKPDKSLESNNSFSEVSQRKKSPLGFGQRGCCKRGQGPEGSHIQIKSLECSLSAGAPRAPKGPPSLLGCCLFPAHLGWCQLCCSAKAEGSEAFRGFLCFGGWDPRLNSGTSRGSQLRTAGSPKCLFLQGLKPANDRIRVSNDLRGCKFEGNGPCKFTAFKLIFTTSPSELQDIPNQEQGLWSTVFHDFKASVELFRLVFPC